MQGYPRNQKWAARRQRLGVNRMRLMELHGNLWSFIKRIPLFGFQCSCRRTEPDRVVTPNSLFQCKVLWLDMWVDMVTFDLLLQRQSIRDRERENIVSPLEESRERSMGTWRPVGMAKSGICEQNDKSSSGRNEWNLGECKDFLRVLLITLFWGLADFIWWPQDNHGQGQDSFYSVLHWSSHYLQCSFLQCYLIFTTVISSSDRSLGSKLILPSQASASHHL